MSEGNVSTLGHQQFAHQQYLAGQSQHCFADMQGVATLCA